MAELSHKTNDPVATPIPVIPISQNQSKRGPGMLTSEEIELLRKSKKEISEVCREYFRKLDQQS